MPITKRSKLADNLGDIKRVRLALASELSIQDYQTLPSQTIEFKAGAGYSFDKTNEDFKFTNLSVTQNTDNGIANNVSFSIQIFNDLLKSNFDPIYRKFEGRLLVAEITSLNGSVAIFAPLICNYEYKQAIVPSESSYYEFSFRKVAAVKFEDYLFPKLLSRYIGDITSDTIDTINFRVKVGSLIPNNITQYQAGFSLLNDVSTVKTWYSTVESLKLIIPSAPNNTKIYVFLKSIATGDYDVQEYTVVVKQYSLRSTMRSLDVMKPATEDLLEFDGSNVAAENSSAGGVATVSISIVPQSIGSLLSGSVNFSITLIPPILTGNETDTNNRTLLSIAAGVTIFKNGTVLAVNGTFTKTDILTGTILTTIPTTSNFVLFSYRAIGTISGNSNTVSISANITQSTNANAQFELTSLRNMLDANPDVAVNRFDLADFPASKVIAQSNYALKLLNADTAEYINVGSVQLKALGLATGFDNNKLRTTAEIGAEDRSIWITAFGSIATGKTEAELETEGENLFLDRYANNVDKNGVNVKFDYTMVDIEEQSSDNGLTLWTIGKLKAYMRGYQNKALELRPNHKYIHYGLTISGFPSRTSGYGYDSDLVPDYKKFFPYIKPSYIARYRLDHGIVSEEFANKGIMFTIMPQYLSAPFPMTEVYKKDGSNNYMTNADGDRLLVDVDVTESYRGITHTWHHPDAAYTFDPITGDTYRKYLHEAHLGLWGIPMLFAQCVYSLQMLSNKIGLGYDISNFHAQSPYLTVGIVRDTLEANSWQNTYRPMDWYSSKAMALISFIMAKNYYAYAGLSGTWGLTNDGSNIYQAVNEGNNIYGTIEPYQAIDNGPSFKPYHNGKMRQTYAMSYRLKALSRDYGIGQKSDKLLVFCDPQELQTRAEILAIGLLQGPVAYIGFIYTAHGVGESTNVTVGNKKNNKTFTFTLHAKEIVDEVFIFPSGDTYNSEDIWIEYTSIKNAYVKVTGNLMFHDVNPT